MLVPAAAAAAAAATGCATCSGLQSEALQYRSAFNPRRSMPAVHLPNGQRLAYSLLGGGGRAAPSQQRLLVVSGLAIPRHAIYVRLLAEHLSSLTDAAGRSLLMVCTYDLRGLGGSSAPRRLGAYTTEALAEDALLLLDHLGWLDGVHLLASSLGGQIACKMAARQPQRFASLLLVGTAQGWQLGLTTALRRPLVSGAMLLGQLPGLHWLATWALLHHLFSNEWLRQPCSGGGQAAGKDGDGSSADGHAQAPTRLAVMLRHSSDPDRPNLLQDCAMHSTARLGQALACVRHGLATRQAEAIRRAGIPVHALTGSHDGITSATSVALLAGSLGALSMRSVHGGHAGIMVEHADAVLAAVERAVLGAVASTPFQRCQAQRQAEAALMQSSFAYWEHILGRWLWAAALECAALLVQRAYMAAFWAVLLWRILLGSGRLQWRQTAANTQARSVQRAGGRID